MISQSNPKPASAPTTVVAISSPLPTIELARMMPGPRADSVGQKPRGGAMNAGASAADGGVGSAASLMGCLPDEARHRRDAVARMVPGAWERSTISCGVGRQVGEGRFRCDAFRESTLTPSLSQRERENNVRLCATAPRPRPRAW